MTSYIWVWIKIGISQKPHLNIAPPFTNINNTETSFQITLTQGSYSMVMDIYEVKFPRQSVTSSGSEPVYLSLPFKAYYQDNVNAVPLKITLVNDVASFA